jgi:hypothetical protein
VAWEGPHQSSVFCGLVRGPKIWLRVLVGAVGWGSVRVPQIGMAVVGASDAVAV